MKRLKAIGVGCLLAAVTVRAELPEVSEEALSELGSTYGTPQMNGFVFIEGRYVPPPYTVTRKGNGIFINRILIEQPVPWSFFTAEPEAGAEPRKKAADADGDFEALAPDAVKPAASAAPAAAAAEPAKPKAVKSIDDLFADDAAPAAAKADVAEQEKADGQAPAAAAAGAPAAPAAAPAQEAVSQPPAVRRDPEELKRLREELKVKIDNVRKGYELALGRGELFFFSERQSRLNGNYGTARALIGVLPDAMRNAQSPLDLMQRLNQGGVYFVDQGVCAALYTNKRTFPLLTERLRQIRESEALDAERRQQTHTR